MACEDYELVTNAYLGHDNTVTIVPYSDLPERVLYDMAAVTEVQVSADLTTSVTTGDSIAASSDDVPITVWWEQIGTTDEWRVYMKVGLFPSISAGTYKLRVVFIEPTFTSGLVIADDLIVEVVDIP